MKHYWILRVLAALFILAGIAVVGVLAYQAGLAQGASAAAPAVPAAVPAAIRMHGGIFPGIFLLPFLFCLAPFFLVIFFCLPMRILFGHRHEHPPFGRWHRWHMGEGEVPPPFEEWHRRSHENKPQS